MQIPASKCANPEKIERKEEVGGDGGGIAGEKGRVHTILKKNLEFLDLSLLEILEKAKLHH